MKKNVNRAFTLVEIMIVVLIIGILLAIAVPNFARAREQSQAAACHQNLRQLDAAAQQYAMDHKIASTDFSTQLDGRDLQYAGYLKSVPECPSGGGYRSFSPNEKPTCSLPSHGWSY